ncbi:MAG: hypothetical protein AAF806_21875 [Bacteroidota bacterium]
MMKVFFILFLSCICFSFSSAQQNTIKHYQDNSIYLQSGFGGFRYVKDGQIQQKGLILAHHLKKELAISPNAVVEFKKYQRDKFIAMGFGLATAGIFTAIAVDSENINPNILWVVLGTSFTTGIIWANAKNKLRKSVWHYNQDILR